MWIDEKHEDFLKISYRTKEVLFSEKSEFQKVEIVETAGHGKMLFNDDLAMLSERDEFVYHDMISHVPLFVHPNPKKVLVIGGGDGGTVREVIRHSTVEKCVLVEIDPFVVEGCKKFIPQTSSALSDSRVEVIIADGVKYMAETSEKYDVVIIDSTDPIGPAAPLFNVDFYSNVKKVLSEDGIVVSQCESPFYFLPVQKAMMKLLGEVFSKVHLYNYSNITYPGGLWSFSFASKGLCPLGDFDRSRVEKSGLEFSWYNENIHWASFQLPEFQRRELSSLMSSFKNQSEKIAPQ